MGNTLAWEKGRQLKTFGTNSYKYNNDGIRIKKQTSDTIHEYILDGTNVIKETVTDTANCPKYINEYLYDLDGTVCGLKYNGVAYYFYKNLQGDIIAITNDSGTVVARYTYDAWGKVTITSDTSGINIATINPFRYRSYYYDTETGLYYLQSRYYNSEVGRFINADDAQILSDSLDLCLTNLFAYCKNDPVNSRDIFGNIAAQLIARAILGMMLGFIIQLLTDVVLYWYSVYVKKSTNPFSVSPGDYFSSMMSWAFMCVVPNTKIGGLLISALPIILKHTWRIFNKKFNLTSLAIDLGVVLIQWAISKAINRRTQKKIISMAKKMSNKKNAVNKIAASTRNLESKEKILGIKVNLTVTISSSIIQLIYDAVKS